MFKGHYEYEIILKYSEEIQDSKTISRRFSDIEWLHDELLFQNPGCKILDIPEKNFWMNLNLNNSQELENRKNLIEKFLNYINKHKYLNKNKSYKDFLSMSFSQDTNKKKSFSEYLENWKKLIPNFKGAKNIGLDIIEDDKELDKHRENLVRLFNSTDKISNTLVK